jgi:hypothetical protein
MPELDVDVAAQLGIRLGESEEEIAKLKKQLAEKWIRPVNLTKGSQATAAGILMLDFHGPSLGFVWAVRRVSASAPAIASQPANTATAYLLIGPPGAAAGQFPLTGSQMVSSSLGSAGTTIWPVEGYWDSKQLIVQQGDYVYFYFTGLTSGESIVASVQAIEVRNTQLGNL